MKPLFILFFMVFMSQLIHAAEGVSSYQIRCGSSMPFKGPGADHAKQMRVGSDLYFSKLNKEGGINGRKVEIITLDNEYSPKVGLENIKSFIEKEKVFCLFQIYGAAVTKAILPVIEEQNLPIVASVTSDESFRNPVIKNLFAIRPSSHIEISNLVPFVMKKEATQSVAVLYQDDALGAAARLATTHILGEQNLKVVASAMVKRDSDDVAAAVDAIMKSGAKVVVLGAQIKQGTAFINLAAEKGYKPSYIGTSTYQTDEFVKLIKSDDAKVYVSAPVPLIDSKTADIVSEFLKEAKAAGIETDQAQLEGYLNAKVLAEALKRAGADPNRDSLRAALETLHNHDFGGVKINYTSGSHRGIEAFAVTALKNRKYVEVK